LALVVERGDYGLAGSGRRHQEVAMAAVEIALGCEAVQDLLLEGKRAERKELGDVGAAAGALGSEGPSEPFAVPFRRGIIAFELRVVPQALIGTPELVDDLRQVGGADLDHPLVAGTERGGRQIRRTDVGGMEASPALEKPCLRVQPGTTDVVRDADLDVREARERVDGLHLRGAREDRGEHPEFAIST
jgi:hypothetical protein